MEYKTLFVSFKISAIVTTYNNKNIIRTCLDSLINQTKNFDEILIVENASTDNTKEIVREYPFRIIQLEKNVERCTSRNIGWRSTQNEIVAIIEADSKYDSLWVEKVLECFEKGADAVEVRRAIYNPDTFISKINDEFFGTRLLKNKYKPYSAWVFKKDVLIDIDGYDEDMVGYEDMDIGIKLAQKGYRVMYQPEAILYHAGEPKTLLQEIKRSWWFGIRTHKFYTKYPEKFPVFGISFFILLNLSFIEPFIFMLILGLILNLLFIKYLNMGMKPLYAFGESVLALLRRWIFYGAYIISSIDKKRRR